MNKNNGQQTFIQFDEENTQSKTGLYDLKGFTPIVMDQDYLNSLSLNVIPDDETLKKLVIGSEQFIYKYQNRLLSPERYFEVEINLDEPMEIHNYTGQCPTNTYEVNPVKNACHVGCLYCLVNDGEHNQDVNLYTNYDKYMRRHLSEQGNSNVFYYFSPKSEAFQEPTLVTGIAHKILREFIKHYKENPDSKVRIFIATKAGPKQLLYQHEGDTILDLLEELKEKVQFNLSIGIFPDSLHDILEPNAASVSERITASRLCQDLGITSNSVLTQPIIGPFLDDKSMSQYFSLLASNNIINFKPEFLTACIENLAMLSQFVGWYDKKIEKELLELYIAPENKKHVKQRGRTAPNKGWSIDMVKKMMSKAAEYGVSTSICYWVRKQLGIDEEMIPIVNRNGFQCLGYQMRLFE